MTTYLDADLRDPAKVLPGAAELLDFREPVGVLLIGVLQLIGDADSPYAIVARLMEVVPAGSWLAIFHPASDILTDQVAEVARHVSVNAIEPWATRGIAREGICDVVIGDQVGSWRRGCELGHQELAGGIFAAGLQSAERQDEQGNPDPSVCVYEQIRYWLNNITGGTIMTVTP